MASNLDMFKEVDEAYNSRDWDLYEQFFADGFVAWGLGASTPRNRREHIEFSKKFCLRFPDNQVANAPYLAALGDSRWTSTLTVISGTEQRSTSDNGSTLVGEFKVRFATLARWEHGKIVEEPVDDKRHNSLSKEFYRYDRDIVEYNGIASNVFTRAKVPVIDLYTFTKQLGSGHYIDHVHWDEGTRVQQAAYIAGFIVALHNLHDLP